MYKKYEQFMIYAINVYKFKLSIWKNEIFLQYNNLIQEY